MLIEIEEWCPDVWRLKPNLLGHVCVRLGGKMFVWMTVFQGENTPFCRFPRVKYENTLTASIGWIDKDNMEREISDCVIQRLKERNAL